MIIDQEGQIIFSTNSYQQVHVPADTFLTAVLCGQKCIMRILLPAVLREFAGITKDAVLVGVGSRVEIWSKDRWEGTVTYQDMEEISRHMIELGIGI